jgi:hypothetical protein
MIRIPKNMVITAQYTSGADYYIKGTNIPYKGYYFVVNDKAFTGKEPTKDSQPLDKTATDAKAAEKNKITPYYFNPATVETHNDEVTRYFIKKTMEIPVKIIEVDKDTFQSVQKNPGYASIQIRWNMLFDNDKVITDGDKKMPGLKIFLTDL